MALPPMSGFDALLQQRLSISDRRKAELEQASQRNKNKFDPLNNDNVDVLDGDTLQLRDSGEKLRISKGANYGVDTFENDEKTYQEQPDRFQSHRRNYAKLTGRPEWTITAGELVERGKVQREQINQKVQDWGNKGELGYKRSGEQGAYGRSLADVYNTKTGESLYADYSGREQNANYDSKYNAGQRLDDILSGEYGRHNAFTGSRKWRDTHRSITNFALVLVGCLMKQGKLYL